MIRAFTGPTDLTRRQRIWVARSMLKDMSKKPEIWRSGCAYGADTVAAYLAIAIDCPLQLFVPFAYHNGTLVNELAKNAEHVIRCPKRSTTSQTYRLRNDWMVGGVPDAVERGRSSQILSAFVWQTEFYRSGEWMTINIAKFLGVEIQMHRIPQHIRGLA